MAVERKRQIEFPPLQTHVKSFEIAMIVISIICIVIMLSSSSPRTLATNSVRPSSSATPAGSRRAWIRPVVLVVGLFAICLAVAASCQRHQIRITQQTAIVTATRHADFRPQRTQVRLVRQGLNGRPFWAISLSIPAKNGNGYERVSVARVDANTGKLVAFTDNADTEKDAP